MSTRNKVRKSLVFSFWDGVFASGTAGFINDYVAPYAIALKASVRQIGYLTAFPFLFTSLIQIFSADITDKFKSRKKVIVIFVLLHTLMLLPMMFIPSMPAAHQVPVLIIAMTLFIGLNSLTGPVWVGLMAEYIPARKRGFYFGWRNKIMSVVALACSYLAGVILQLTKNHALRGFIIIIGAAMLARLASWYCLSRMYEPAYRVKHEAYFSFLDFIGSFRTSNFARFVFFVAGLQFCVNLSAPFFSVLMLRELQFSYLTYTVIVTSATAAQIFFIGRWGRFADKTGNIKVMRLTSLIIATLPLWWIAYRHPVYLIFIQLLGGFAWAGFNLCAGNFVYDAVTPQKRIRCQGYFSVVVALAVALGGIIGGRLAQVLPALCGYKILSLFLLSSALRFVIITFLARGIKEVRPIEKMNSRTLLAQVIGVQGLFKAAKQEAQGSLPHE